MAPQRGASAARNVSAEETKQEPSNARLAAACSPGSQDTNSAFPRKDYRLQMGYCTANSGTGQDPDRASPKCELEELGQALFLPDVKLPTPYQEANHSSLRPVAHRMRP